MAFEMKPRKQCTKCPWKVSTDPRDIPGGYCVEKHANLARTIATPGEVMLGGVLRIMACHETTGGRELPCVGWLVHQLGPGNNIPLRLAARDGRYGDVRTVGPQHATFEDTLPKERP